MAQPKAFRMIRDSQFARDLAVTTTTVSLDTSKWSSRKKNIVLDAVRTGVAACGWQTGHLVREMMQALGSDVQHVTKWSNTIDTALVKPEMLEDLIAYTCAWIKLTAEPVNERGHYYQHWHASHFVEQVDKGSTPKYIPLPTHLSDAEKREFAAKYMRDPSETDRIARDTLIAMITNGETIGLKFSA